MAPNLKLLKKLYGGGDSDVFLIKFGGRIHVLKIYNLFSLKAVLAEIRIMNFLAGHSFPVPRPIKFKDGRQYFLYQKKPAIIYPYLEGKMAKDSKITPEICREVGSLMAKIDLKLRELEIPAVKSKKTEWDLMQFEKVRPMIKFLPGRYDYLLPEIKKTLAEYKKNSRFLKRLPKNLVLNDVSETNLLINSGKISGLVDFSDMVYAPYICNLAVAAAHLCFDDKNWKKKLIFLVGAYQKINPLPESHYQLLPLLIRCRLITRLLANCYNGLRQKKFRQVQWMMDWAEKRLKKEPAARSLF